jgi:hypothetical protein
VAALIAATAGLAHAQDGMQEGAIELSGGTHGCVKLDHRSYVIKYGEHHFRYPPGVDVSAAADDDNVNITVATGSISRNAAQIVVTATGPSGHQVCTPSRVTWTITSNDD